jgi:hypothetical protein
VDPNAAFSGKAHPGGSKLPVRDVLEDLFLVHQVIATPRDDVSQPPLRYRYAVPSKIRAHDQSQENAIEKLTGLP